MSRRIAFDTSVFVALFEGQQTHDLRAIAGLVDDIDAGRAILLVPTVVIGELFCKATNIERFEQFLQGASVVVCDLTEPAAKLAGRIREDCLSRHDFKPGMPDTLIAASAQQFQATKIYTLDEPMLRLHRCELVTVAIGRPDGQQHMFPS